VLKNRNYALLSAYLYLFFFAQAMSISLLSIWYTRTLGLSGTEVGIVFSATFFVALVLQPLYGYLSDKAGLRKHVLWFVSLMCVSSGLFFAFVYGPLLTTNIVAGAACGGLFIGMTFVAGAYAVESYVDRVGRKYGFEYGRARLWGSLGFASAAFFSGRLFNIDPAINFTMAAAAGVLLCIVVFFTRVEPSEADRQSTASLSLRDALVVLGMKKFWGFMVLILGVTNLYLVYDQQFPIYFASLFPTPEQGNVMFGYLNSAQIFVEAGMMFLAPSIVSRIGARNGLLLAASIMIVRMAGSGIVTGPVAISSMKMLHSLELPIMLVSVFKYIAWHFDNRLCSTIYMVGWSFGHSLGLAVLSPLVGQLYDRIGFPNTYLLLAAFAAVFLVCSFFTLSPTPPAGALARPTSGSAANGMLKAAE
jgi:MFS transporter, OHS family, lactose permease